MIICKKVVSLRCFLGESMNDLVVIQQKIFEIRNQRVMMDRDLAALYGVETRTLHQAVRRNIHRFPPDFMFQLTKEELADWKSQTVISNSIKMGLRKPPMVFTELGVAMLSSVLNSDTAININISIMRAFVELRRLTQLAAVSYQELQREINYVKDYIEDILKDQNDINEEHSAQLEAISIALAELQTQKRQDKPRNPIGFR